VTSSEGLRNLVEMMGGSVAAQLKATPLFVTHRRIANEAGGLGFREAIVTAPGDAGLLQGLEAYFCKERK
jgi:uroporphyrinogen-III synthase